MDIVYNIYNQFHDPVICFVIVAACIICGIALKALIIKLLNLYIRHSDPFLLKSLVRHLDHPLTLFIPTLLIALTLPILPISSDTALVLKRVIEMVNIALFGWMLIKLTLVAQDVVQDKYNITKTDNFKERKIVTQINFLRKLAIVIITLITVSIILLSFEAVRKLGTGLLTSAGIVGIVVGFAAQQSIANLLAGLQVAFTQPIRIDDVLVVENEWGRVEDITLTYVVVSIWDQRRLVLPLKYFIEKPFQNWTRSNSEIIGSVFIYTDYTIPVDKIREEFDRIIKSTALWNGKVSVLQVTDSKEHTLELRALMSANSSGVAWDLRCLVRERLVSFIQKNYPDSLPRIRTELVSKNMDKVIR